MMKKIVSVQWPLPDPPEVPPQPLTKNDRADGLGSIFSWWGK